MDGDSVSSSSISTGSSKSKSSKSPRSIFTKLGAKVQQITKKEIDKAKKRAHRDKIKAHELFIGEYLRCDECHKRLEKKIFQSSSNPGKFYHEKCVPKCGSGPINVPCCICDKAITGNYGNVAFYNLVYCIEHDRPVTCSACSRKKNHKSPEFIVHDGRSLCPDCSKTVVEDDFKIQEIFFSIIAFMENELKIAIPSDMRDVEVHSMESRSLNEKSKSSATTHGVLRGITHSMCVNDVRSVTGVFILTFMPEDLCYNVIAHEAMHVLLKLSRDVPFRLDPKVEEGLCEAMAYKYLLYVEQQQRSLMHSNQSNQSNLVNSTSSSDVSDSRRTEQRSLLRQYLCCQIQRCKDPVYGKGFTEAVHWVSELGFVTVLDHLIESGGRLPVCGECDEASSDDLSGNSSSES